MNPLVLLDPEGDALAQSLLALQGSLEVCMYVCGPADSGDGCMEVDRSIDPSGWLGYTTNTDTHTDTDTDTNCRCRSGARATCCRS